jgi:IS30 family transposase
VKRLNSRPRKNLEYKKPGQLMSAHRAALAA